MFRWERGQLIIKGHLPVPRVLISWFLHKWPSLRTWPLRRSRDYAKGIVRISVEIDKPVESASAHGTKEP